MTTNVTMSKKLSPAQQQYMELKQQHNDCLLFFRLGDFYELFYDDAKIAHKVLGITLTARNKKADNPIPMAGIPHHALEKYVPVLIKAGYKIALAEQVSKPQPGKVVDRKVTQVITPGTYIGSQSAEQYILSVVSHDGAYQLAWGDFTIGRYVTRTVHSVDELEMILSTIEVVEVVVDTQLEKKEMIRSFIDGDTRPVTERLVPYDAQTFVKQQLGVKTLSGYGKAVEGGTIYALSLLFHYLEETQKRQIGSIYSLQYAGDDEMMHIDAITLKNLEIFQSSYEGSATQSLFGVMDVSYTAMGSRLLASWLRQPTMNMQVLTHRADRISAFMADSHLRSHVQSRLKHCPDIPRLLTSIMYRKPSPAKIQSLQSVVSSVFLDEASLACLSSYGGMTGSAIEELKTIYEYIASRIKDGATHEAKDFIVDGADAEVDRLRQIAYKSDELLLQYQQMLVQKSGVSNVKIAFIKNQGYSLEVTPKDIEQFETIIDAAFPELDMVRTQSLKGGQRYVSTYLGNLQEDILQASSQLVEREGVLLLEVIENIERASKVLFEFADALALIDVSASHATFSLTHKWTRPAFSVAGEVSIEGGWHPVVKSFLARSDQFIPNDLHLTKEDYFHLITGPNMGGKSTYLRQNALIVLLAQVGCMVPADRVEIPLFDGLFARVGSGDALAKNQSTFMTEMIEMANILHHATSQSFVVLDELGRGTSTYDGLALAKAITVYLCQERKANVLFATHYHELTDLEGSLNGFSNWHVDVLEKDEHVVFLKKIVAGGASKSYGIDVATFAGVPQQITMAAQTYLHELETQASVIPVQQHSLFPDAHTQAPSKDASLVTSFVEEISSIDINSLSPLDAFQKLVELQKQAGDF